MGAIICDFGRNSDGLFLYRINGEKKEINKYIGELKELGCELYEPVELEKTWKQYSVLLKIKFPPEVEDIMEKEKQARDKRNREQDAIRDNLRKKSC